MSQQVRFEKLFTLFDTIGKNLSMEEFDDRLEVQKIPFLAQSFGINLDYSFTWYLKGPYSKTVAKDGFTVYELLKNDQTPNLNQDLLNHERLNEFREFISPHMDDPLWLEVAASLVYLRKENYAEEPLDQIIGYLIEDLTYGYKNFDEALVRRVISELHTTELLNN